jgi:hypothetical protein
MKTVQQSSQKKRKKGGEDSDEDKELAEGLLSTEGVHFCAE